ncbi:MAG: 50S ribosomal protein L29 [Helicobacteraceae bacterium]|jgi:large subunit ribosomal protein L29|nr:50S ribosomal protein L29 [Helicobacteraceae bacterium]
MKYTEIKALGKEELAKSLKEKKLQLFSLRMKLKTMQLSNTNEIGQKRKEIARILTALKESK